LNKVTDEHYVLSTNEKREVGQNKFIALWKHFIIFAAVLTKVKRSNSEQWFY